MNRKEIASTFLQLAGTGEVQKAFDQFVALAFRLQNFNKALLLCPTDCELYLPIGQKYHVNN